MRSTAPRPVPVPAKPLAILIVLVAASAALSHPSPAARSALAPVALAASAAGPAPMRADSGSGRDSLKNPASSAAAPAASPAVAPAPAPAAAPLAPAATAPAAPSAGPAATPAAAPALDPEPSDRESVRRARRAEREAIRAQREAIRAERYERRLAVQASRDSARRLDNFYVGAGLVTAQYEAYSGSDSEATETSSPMGIWFGYRTHFARLFGFRAGGLAHFGSTEVVRGAVDPIFPGTSSYGYQVSGSRGMTFEIDASAQAILGPFGRFAIEPGAFYGFGWHTAKSIPLDAGPGNARYEPRPRYSVAGGMLAASLLFGSRDQFSPTGFLAFGKALGTAEGSIFNMGLGFTIAFQDG